jgi:predicted secreted protein
MSRRYFILIPLLLLCVSMLAQPVIRTNEKGEAIIVFPDGTTMPFAEYSANGGMKPQSGNKYPVLDVEIAPLEGQIPITAEDLRRISERQTQIAQNAADIAQQRALQADKQLRLLREEYDKAMQRQASQQEIKRLSLRLNEARKTAEEAEREANIAKTEAYNAEEITKRGTYVEDYLQRQEQQKAQARQYENLKLTATASYDNTLLDEDGLPFAHSSSVMVSPPTPVCEYSYEGKDTEGRYRRDIEKSYLFSHTDERLRPFLEQGKEYLSCSGFFTQIGGFRYLSLEFTFAYPNAREAYGFIEKGSYLMIKMLNSQFVTLFSGKMDRGTYDTQTQLLTYSVHYPIDQSQLNLLKRNEVDKIVVSWSSGYEEYEVYALDFFINQIRCLEK